MTKRTTTKTQDPWGDPLNWEPRTYVDLHPNTQDHNRNCPQCARSIRWTKNYMAKVNGR